MAKTIVKLTLEGKRPSSLHVGKSGVAISLDEDVPAENWLWHLRTALGALYQHELKRAGIETAETGALVTDFISECRDLTEGEF